MLFQSQKWITFFGWGGIGNHWTGIVCGRSFEFDGWMVVWGLEKRSQINNKAFNVLYVICCSF